MAKNAFYFSHDNNARNDDKILALTADYRMEGYGRYWALIEMLHESNGYKLEKSKWLSRSLSSTWYITPSEAEKFLEDLIHEYELIEEDDECIWSNSLLRRMEKREEVSNARRKAVQARWKNHEEQNRSDTKPIQKNTNAIENDAKERKGKERKEKEIKGKEEDGSNPSSHPAIPPEFEIPTNKTGESFPITLDDIQGWEELYPAVDVRQEIRKMIGWSDSNPRKRKTLAGMKRFITSWLGREQDKGGTKGYVQQTVRKGIGNMPEPTAEEYAASDDVAAYFRANNLSVDDFIDGGN